MKIFCQRLNGLMQGKTQTEVSKTTGVSQQTLSRYLAGSCRPSVSNLIALCRYFTVSSDYMLGIESSTRQGEKQ